MSEHKVYPVPAAFSAKTLLNAQQYAALYRQSVDDPEGFWAQQATDFLTWTKPWHKVLEWDFNKAYIRWFEGGKLNVTTNCIDRHLATRGDQTALIWEGDDPTAAKDLLSRTARSLQTRPTF